MFDEGTGIGIFYLDSRRDSCVRKTLKKYGRVYYARDIDQALPLLVESQFSYFFIDADLPMAQVFIKHLRHDPQISKPGAIVLLTENDDEDCDAWLVDTYIKRSRFAQDVPYIFSHLKPEPETEGNVVHIAREISAQAQQEVAFLKERAKSRSLKIRKGGRLRILEKESVDSRRSSEESVSCSQVCDSGHLQPDAFLDHFEVCEIPPDKSGCNRSDDVFHGSKTPRSLINVKKLMTFFCVCMIAGFALWVLTVGPLSGSSTRDWKQSQDSSVKSYSRRKSKSNEVPFPVSVEQYSSRNNPPDYQSTPQANFERESAGADQIQDNQANSKPPEETNMSEMVAQKKETRYENETKVTENRPPLVSISGPVEVLHRQTVVYTAVASDPDGDRISYSWGGNTKTVNWSTPGIYQVSVTVTDSRGLSASATLTVRVI